MGIVHCNSDRGCFAMRVPDSGGAPGAGLSASVGLGGRNLAEDVRTVQMRLNGITPAAGGPEVVLEADGLCGPKTNAAIQRFQKKQFGWSDGRADPGGPTIKRLEELAGDPLVRRIPADEDAPLQALRIATMMASVPDAKTAVRQAISRIQQAFNVVMLGGGGLTTDPASFDLVDRHFLFKGVGREQTLSELRSIETTFGRMKTILDNRASVFGGPMFGVNMFELDRRPDTPKDVKAYVPRASSVDTRSDGLTPHKMYLCKGLDRQTQDRFTHILIHELGHFVDDEHPDTEITDHGYAFFGTLDKLPHDKRMHNADTYAIFAFENAFGRARVKAMFPNLK